MPLFIEDGAVKTLTVVGRAASGAIVSLDLQDRSPVWANSNNASVTLGETDPPSPFSRTLSAPAGFVGTAQISVTDLDSDRDVGEIGDLGTVMGDFEWRGPEAQTAEFVVT